MRGLRHGGGYPSTPWTVSGRKGGRGRLRQGRGRGGQQDERDAGMRVIAEGERAAVVVCNADLVIGPPKASGRRCPGTWGVEGTDDVLRAGRTAVHARLPGDERLVEEVGGPIQPPRWSGYVGARRDAVLRARSGQRDHPGGRSAVDDAVLLFNDPSLMADLHRLAPLLRKTASPSGRRPP